jgi:hypothetical protein
MHKIVTNIFPHTESYSEILVDVKKDSKFIVSIRAENSAGESPLGYCMIDTTTIPTGRLGSDLLSGLSYFNRLLLFAHTGKMITFIFFTSSSDGKLRYTRYPH